MDREQNTVVWIDLEETIINSWYEGVFTEHIAKIKDWLDFIKPEHINIWSFAIWDEEDREKFVSSEMKYRIETTLGYEIIEYPSVQNMYDIIREWEMFSYQNQEEFMQINGKLLSFIKYARTRSNEKLFLIDDSVPYWNLYMHKNNVSAITLNVEHDI